MTVTRSLEALRRDAPLLVARSTDELTREYGRLLDLVHPAIMSGRISIDQARVERFQALARFCGTDISWESAERLTETYRGFYRGLRRPVEGAVELLQHLRGRTILGIVSNNQVSEQEEKLVFLGIDSFVDFLVVSETVGVGKPDPAIFRVALERANVGARDAVMVGDSWASDVVGARGVGMRAVWFNRFGQTAPDPWPVSQIRSYVPLERAEAAIAGSDAPTAPSG